MTTAANRFWSQTEAILDEVPADGRVQRDGFYSQPDWDVFQMRYTSADGYWLYAWLSVPKGDGPFPAIVRMPDYGSVHDIVYTPFREGVVVMNPTFRGQRQSDHSIQAEFPGLLTEGIEDTETYIMRRVFADALRGFDALLAQDQANLGNIAVIGAGLGGIFDRGDELDLSGFFAQIAPPMAALAFVSLIPIVIKKFRKPVSKPSV